MNKTAARLMELRDQIAALEKEAAVLRSNLIHRYGVGDHKDFSITEQTVLRLDHAALEKALGDLTPYKMLNAFMKVTFNR